jgi:hypothetical protein
MASYNCSDSTSSAYGEGNYGTCTEQSVGAPNTGVFSQFMGSGTFTIVVPLAAAIVIVVVATAIVGLRKRAKRNS